MSFFFFHRLLLDNESEMMAAKCTHINHSIFYHDSTIFSGSSNDEPLQRLSQQMHTALASPRCNLGRMFKVCHCEGDTEKCVDMKES